MDTPENCGGAAGMGSVSLSQTSAIPEPEQRLGDVPAGRLWQRDQGHERHVRPGGGAGTQTVMGIYAPFSTVNMTQLGRPTSAPSWRSRCSSSNSVKVTYDPLIQNLDEDPLLVYHRSEYLECTNVATGTRPTRMLIDSDDRTA